MDTVLMSAGALDYHVRTGFIFFSMGDWRCRDNIDTPIKIEVLTEHNPSYYNEWLERIDWIEGN